MSFMQPTSRDGMEVWQVAENVAEASAQSSQEQGYMAGVEDALRWVLGSVGDDVFTQSGFLSRATTQADLFKGVRA